MIAKATGYPATGGAMFLKTEQPRQIFITPLAATSLFTQDWQTPLALVFVLEADTKLSALNLLGKLYALTPTELKVTVGLLAGNSPEEYAKQAGVSVSTIRSHLKSLFSKTGTNKQSQLVALLSHAPPLQ